MLKGETTIELTDVHTGEKEEIKSENMFTNALQNILDTMGRFCSNQFNKSNYFPILKNLLGGIMLFNSPIEEDVNNISPPTADEAECVACANVYTNSTSDLKRGSLNKTESGELEGGYRFVWDFTTSQGNGQIACAALTTKTGGIYGATPNRYGGILLCSENDTTTIDSFDRDDGYGFSFLSSIAVGPILSIDGDDTSLNTENLRLKDIIAFDADKMCFSAAKCQVVNGKLTLFLFDIYMGLSGLQLKDYPAKLQKIKNCRSCEICSDGEAFGSLDTLPAVVMNPNEEFCYVIKSVSSSTLAVAKVNKTTMHLEYCKSGDITPHSISTSGYIEQTKDRDRCVAAVQNNYLYIMGSYSRSTKRMLKINTDNLTEINEISCVNSNGSNTYGSYSTAYFESGIMAIYQGKRIIVPYGIIENDQISLTTFGGHMRETVFVSGGIIKEVLAYYIESNWGNLYAGIIANAMMTINNLPTPVVKTADKTMKITYIVRDVDESI